MFKETPKRIAILLPSLKFGGAERVALNLGRTLSDISIKVDFLLMSAEGDFLGEASLYGRVVDLNCKRTRQLPLALVKYFFSHRPDAIISSFWKLNLSACFARIFFPPVKLLLWEHSPPSKVSFIPNWLYFLSSSFFYRFSNRIIAVSTGVLEDVEKLSIGLNSRLKVIPNPIYPPVSSRAVARVSGPRNRIVWVGRLDEPKNPILALEAFARLKVPDAILVFIGDGVLLPDLEKRRTKLCLEDKVSFLGFCSDPYPEIARSDLLLISSDREGLPSVAIEALHCGLRIVATDCGSGIREILSNGILGSITPIGDINALAAAISLELNTKFNPSQQIAGGERYLPHVVRSQFLAALR
ncbi:glycosyltransferase [Amylibacter sp.]|nr:glycosyltransferase [Amylibacter sp.]